ncbi:CotH kinase family protein [Bacteroidales bacterium OttesenSCG-928-I21]|nr:CotH kinase family protein [Bacteroidales bacterium OttesenSCG-928-I21]
MKKTIFTLFAVFVVISAAATDPYFLFSPKGVAQVEIRMLDGKNFWDIWVSGNELDENGNVIEINETEKLEANMWIRNSADSNYEPSELVNGGIRIRIKGRGNTSFHNDKRGYSIELVENSKDAEGEYVERPRPLLGMGNHDEWALMSMWLDKSFFRIPLAFWLGQRMSGIDYTAQLRFVELTVVNSDGSRDYRGLFALSEKAHRGDDRVKLKKLTDAAADQIEPRVTGGYMIECVPNDKMKNKAEYEKRFLIPGWENDTYHHYVFQYPNSKRITDPQRDYMIQYMQDVHDILYSENFTDTISGYLNYIDENSFIDWCILHDLSKGTDNLFHASIFMKKDRNEKLRMTCPWDFDLSFGNVEEGNGCYYEDGFHIRQTKYFNRLWEDPRFYKKLKARYDSLMPLFDLVPYVLQENYNFLESLGVLEREYDRYGEKSLDAFKYKKPYYLSDREIREGKTPDGEYDKIKVDVNTYKGHVRYLTEWFESRKAWMYYNLGETADERCERMQKVRPVMRVIKPENLLDCEMTNTQFMRGYVYNLQKGASGEHEGYASNLYQIKRNDGEYMVQVVDEKGCVSIPSLPVELCQERIYTEPAIPVIPDMEQQPPRISGPSNVIQKPDASEIAVYPNPAKNYIFINADENMFVELFDIKGSKLKETKEDYLNISDIPQGVYFVKLSGTKNIVVKKIVKN